ncbi:hypothetical protein LY90DRAFT_669722 [Neocallimastix californiae]|jgi:hypothetical protein|uniref:Coth-domain-containing protein n=1 Tax=Neocallimastix californiae TaxID=1754190 RepID=A0A1Y2D7E5_9FUNG|nr:hypothetical protein LY90DRAFT_669722 [Neocallimastix californiae]|eukprot:ORY55199.1 hypothetical protein LY90DRAFT_669722 [Neocallimastix californiae]
MNCNLILLILTIVIKIWAAKFTVVSFNGPCKLNIGGALYRMESNSTVPNLYKAYVTAKPGTKYNYICGGKQDVSRTLSGEKTYNELFGRSLTIYDMPEFGYNATKPWTRSIGRTELFDPDYVPIVIIDVDKSFFTKAGGGIYKFNNMTFILKQNAFTFKKVKVDTKNTDEDKFQMKIRIQDDDGIYHRNVLKFRSSAYDPAFIRQILYGDIAHAIGIPAHESVAVRVYHSDGTPIGLYVLQEDVTSESFIRTAFYGNPDGTIKKYKKTPIYDGATGGDFNVYDRNQLSAFISDVENDMKIDLLEMTRQVYYTNPNDPKSVKNLDENWLDLDTFYRALALEYLAGHWDSFWFLTSNFVVYHPDEETEGTQYNYKKFKYYFIDQDFDQTFSIGMKESLSGMEKKPYTEFVNKDINYWQNTINSDEISSRTGINLDPGTRIIINKFLGCDGFPTCQSKTTFEEHLKSIVKHLFNPVAMKRKVNGYKKRLDEEIKWDTSLTRLYKAKDAHNRIYYDSYDMFIRALNEGVSSSHGILNWVEDMANNVCKQFGIKYDEVPMTPESISKEQAELSKIRDKSENVADVEASESTILRINISIILLATITSIFLLY